MRLRKIKGAEEYLRENSDLVIMNSEGVDLVNIFNNSNKELNLEIGCGKGQFIINLAKLNPSINYLAIEKYDSVLYKAVKRYNELTDKPTNLKFVLGDFNDIYPNLAKESLDIIYLNFSDPWPKERHAKRRLTNVNFLNKYKELLKENGVIIQKTDNHDLFYYSLEQYPLAGFKQLDISYDLHKTDIFNIKTEFEEKWQDKGPIYYVKVAK